MTPADPLAAASIFLAGKHGASLGVAPLPDPPSGAPGVLVQLGNGTFILSPEQAHRLALTLTHAAQAVRAAYHAWEQEQEGVATPPLPFEYPEVRE